MDPVNLLAVAVLGIIVVGAACNVLWWLMLVFGWIWIHLSPNHLESSDKPPKFY